MKCHFWKCCRNNIKNSHYNLHSHSLNIISIFLHRYLLSLLLYTHTFLLFAFNFLTSVSVEMPVKYFLGGMKWYVTKLIIIIGKNILISYLYFKKETYGETCFRCKQDKVCVCVRTNERERERGERIDSTCVF